jgi:O-antigen ligase
MRYVAQIKTHLTTNQIYFKIYKSGFEVFKDNKIFGVGNKNYRVETCDLNKKEIYYCTTHPHQIYFEILSEHGILGSIFIFLVLYKLIFSKIGETLRNNNYILIASLIYSTLIFLPLLPSGAFFSDYMLTLFIINLSIFYSSSKVYNIFRK